MASSTKVDAAEMQFKKAQRAQDAKKAMAEYEAAGIAMRAKSAKLKALRLARDAEQAGESAPPEAKKIKKTRAK